MTEEFLHYIWRYGLYRQESLITDGGLSVSIIKPGWLNKDAGPDFMNARIRIGDAEWIGHVEIHLKASDWYQHKHQYDPHYDQVILHVVYQLDRQVFTTGGHQIPAIELVIDDRYYQTYTEMVSNLSPIPCGSAWQSLPMIEVESAIVSMGVDRLKARFEWLSCRMELNRGGWKNLALQVLFRGFGFGKNHENLDLLAQSIDHLIIERHYSNVFQLESLLFGQAGMIPERHSDPYVNALLKEYRYLSGKYELKIPQNYHWNRKRTRPGNQPAVRIAQLAAWLSANHDYFELLISSSGKSSKVGFDASVSSYWKAHVYFDQPAKRPNLQISNTANTLLFINVLLPLSAFYYHQHGDEEALNDWVDQLEQLPAEDNAVIRNWQDAGFRIPNAFYSQSFLYIYKNYCVHRKCLQCRLGRLIIRE
ncbi:MAG: DUF2851 family protein [Bacteroidales bacterium]|nr:DUF2851 family protein [Bacteroidales bacterium]